MSFCKALVDTCTKNEDCPGDEWCGDLGDDERGDVCRPQPCNPDYAYEHTCEKSGSGDEGTVILFFDGFGTFYVVACIHASMHASM